MATGKRTVRTIDKQDDVVYIKWKRQTRYQKGTRNGPCYGIRVVRVQGSGTAAVPEMESDFLSIELIQSRKGAVTIPGDCSIDIPLDRAPDLIRVILELLPPLQRMHVMQQVLKVV